MRGRPTVPFAGTPPATFAGCPVECRNILSDEWVPMVALGEPHYDRANAIGKTYLTVPVTTEVEWRRQRTQAKGRNWPAEDVRVS